MNDKFLTEFQKEPRPEFAQALFEKINDPVSTPSTVPLRKWKPAFAALLAVGVTAVLFSVPAVRALAQDFLDLFRVKKFAAIPVDSARINQLRETKMDFQSIFGQNKIVLKEPGKPQYVANPEAAQVLTGISLLKPTVLPAQMGQPEIWVQDSSSVRFTADGTKLQNLLDTLAITDVKVPEGLNGATITINTPTAVFMKYSNEREEVTLVQARSPEITLPKNVDMSQLGQIALRVIGLSEDEARTFSRTIDWHSTLIVPVPTDAGSFREVNVRNTTGLLITSTEGRSSQSGPRRRKSVLLWSENNKVYALMGLAQNATLIEMANSLN